MEGLVREQFFSNPGKATKHNFDIFKSYSPRDSPVKTRPDLSVDPVKLLTELIKQKNASKIGLKKPKNSSSFLSTGRDLSLELSDSPGSGHYSPRFEAIDPYIGCKKYLKHKKIETPKKIYLPKCLDSTFQCRGKATEKLGEVDKELDKTVLGLFEYESKVKGLRNLTPIPELAQRVASPVKFHLQKSRDPFVKEGSGASPLRFEYQPTKEHTLIRYKRPESVDFGKTSGRTDEKLKISPEPYNKNPEALMKKLVKDVIFDKQVGRKPLILKHLLKTPNSPDLKKIEKGFSKLGNIRGATRLPLMKNQTPRDDSMYKITEAYNLSKSALSKYLN